MIELGLLRIATNDGVPFAREKLRTCLVAAGLKPPSAPTAPPRQARPWPSSASTRSFAANAKKPFWIWRNRV